MPSPRTVALASLALGLCASGDAWAYTISSAVTDGCHERITSEALRRVRDELALAAIEPSDDERALIDDLQFNPDDDMLDLAAVTLLLGVRDNDLKGHAADDLSYLAQVHADPATQDEHCLRSVMQDEPGGSQAAVDACRAFIEQRVEQALDGLDQDGDPDPSSRTVLAVHAAIRGGVDVPLPTYYLRMGQALHALEDGFSHSYRTADGKAVVVALNWLEVVDGTLVESRDGPPHSSALDACDDADDARRLRRELATDAAEEMLRATLRAGRTREQKMTEVRAVLDKYLSYQPGCGADDAWCDAPEAYYDQGCGCRVIGTRGAARGAGYGLVVGLLALARRRRRRALFAVSLTTLCLAVASPAAAQPAADPAAKPPAADPPAKPPDDATSKTTVIPSDDPDAAPTTATQTTTPESTITVVTTPTSPDGSALPPPVIVPVPEPGPTNPSAIAWGGAITGAGAIDKAALAGALGLRVRLHKNWAVGVDAEWNPFISITGGEPVRTGAFNIYASGILRFPLAYEDFNLRSSLAVGTSILLSDLYGAPQGTAGLFLGANLLGLEYKASKVFYLIINPLGVAIPIPQLAGVPFLYPQYRLSLGLEFYGG